MFPLGKWRLVSAIVIVTIALDQLSKAWALDRLDGNRTIGLVPSLELDLAFNSGFSFSTGTGAGPIIGVLVIVVCGVIAWQIRESSEIVRAGLFATVLGGALGNLIDRIFRADDGLLSGEVVDFIDVSWYAVFNLADIFVVCGALALVTLELRRHRRRSREPHATLAS